MKRIALYIAIVLSCVSCRIEKGRTISAYDFVTYSEYLLEGGLGTAHDYFKAIQCAEMYIDYEGADRDLQWFSRYLSAEMVNEVMVIKLKNRSILSQKEIRVKTNRKPFCEPGAVYTVDGFTFICKSNDGMPVWSVSCEGMVSEVAVGSSEILGLEYIWTGQGADIGIDKELTSKFDFNLKYRWNYADEYDSYVYSYKNGVQEGNYEVDFFRSGSQIDWVKAEYKNGIVTLNTSRGDGNTILSELLESL